MNFYEQEKQHNLLSLVQKMKGRGSTGSNWSLPHAQWVVLSWPVTYSSRGICLVTPGILINLFNHELSVLDPYFSILSGWIFNKKIILGSIWTQNTIKTCKTQTTTAFTVHLTFICNLLTRSSHHSPNSWPSEGSALLTGQLHLMLGFALMRLILISWVETFLWTELITKG